MTKGMYEEYQPTTNMIQATLSNGKQGYLLPNIVKQSQSPEMRPFVTKTTKNIQKLKQQRQGGGTKSSMMEMGTEYSKFSQNPSPFPEGNVTGYFIDTPVNFQNSILSKPVRPLP